MDTHTVLSSQESTEYSYHYEEEVEVEQRGMSYISALSLKLNILHHHQPSKQILAKKKKSNVQICEEMEKERFICFPKSSKAQVLNAL